MISKTKIQERLRGKKNLYLVETIILAKKNNHLELANKLAVPTRRQAKINLNELNNLNEKHIIYPGKVLANGDINKKMIVVALGFSSQAKEKLNKAGCETKTIKEELLKNPDLKGVKIL
ncbi:MAG: uL15 family ribosomal protein [Nanoarchaeota archaeon]|nr:uL15 family ribosomal protein [Nanoarchaeota archaeon]